MDFNEARDDGVLGCSGISGAYAYANNLHLVPDRYTSTPSLNFYRPGAFPDVQSTMSKPTHTHPFNGPLFGTTQVSRYQKGKTNLDFTGARDSEWQWHQLGMCKSAPRSRQITMPAPHHSVAVQQLRQIPPYIAFVI